MIWDFNPTLIVGVETKIEIRLKMVASILKRALHVTEGLGKILKVLLINFLNRIYQ